LARGATGSYELLRAGIPILAALAATSAVLAVPTLVLRSLPTNWPLWLVDLASGINRARRSLRRPSWRLLGAAGYLGFDIAALGATFAAAGHPLPLAPLVLGYVIGYLANLVPVPGGFGVLEGGLAGTLIAYGAPAAQATAAVIIYHAIAFWIPSLGGLIGYALLRRRLNVTSCSGTANCNRSLGLVPDPATSTAAIAPGSRRPVDSAGSVGPWPTSASSSSVGYAPADLSTCGLRLE
jgi:Lysylphosphatidylglycerol synthase TM region